MSIGQIIGMTTLPFLSDRYGRKAAMYTYWFVLAMSVLCETVATTWPVWLIAKLLAGMGVGCLQLTIPTYIAEVAPVRIRGSLLMTYNFWFGLGQFFAPVALQVLSQSMPNNFRIPIYTQWGQIGLMLLIYVFIPESPAWAISKGKTDLAKKSLTTLNKGVIGFDVEKQYQIWAIAIEHEEEIAREARNERWYAIFKGVNGKRTLVALWTLLTQQFIGLTLFSTFGSYFFQQAGLEDPFMATCITSGVNIAAGIVYIILADKIGRRLMACSGSTLCLAANIAVGILAVVPKGKSSNILLVFFATLWSMYSCHVC